MSVPDSHPRKMSLEVRHKLIEGYRRGLVADAGLIAHGRGEAFDYLLGEETSLEAEEAGKVAVVLLLLSDKSVISVNGNTAALVPEETVELARVTDSLIEVNLFYRSREREELVKERLEEAGAEKVYGVGVEEKQIPGLESDRALADEAILEADVVLVALEDGDRTEALKGMGKKVIAVDLNPLSRTAQQADVSIIDNVVRAFPNMISFVRDLRDLPREELEEAAAIYDNDAVLEAAEKRIRGGLKEVRES